MLGLSADVAGQHFAVGGNGLVYPLLSVGVADLHQDILAAIAADDERASGKKAWLRILSFSYAWPEDYSLAHLSLLPLKSSLLLRLVRLNLRVRFDDFDRACKPARMMIPAS